MKKNSAKIITKTMTVLILTVLFLMNPLSAFANEALDVVRAKGYNLDELYAPQGSIITEVNTGQILWAENINQQWNAASLTKLMTVTLAYDAMKEGKFSLDTEVPVSQKALDISVNYNLSNNVMVEGCKYTVSELMDLIFVPSSAAATSMVMDLIEPDMDKYVDMLNARAKELGMVNTVYANPIGVPNSLLNEFAPTNASGDKDTLITCADYAILADYLLKNYPEITTHTDEFNIVVKAGTKYEEKFEGYNHSLPGSAHPFPGVDGLKTGSASRGYNHVVTCKQGDMRLVQVILGVASWEHTEAEQIRSVIGNALLEEAFANYEYKTIVKKGEYKVGSKKVVVEEDLVDCVSKTWDGKLKWDFENKTVSADLEREYLPGFSAPKVSFKVKFPIIPVILGAVGVIVLILLLLAAIRRHMRRKRSIMSRRRKRTF